MRNPRAEEIRFALESVPPETVADALALFLSQNDSGSATASATRPEFANFAQAIQFLRKNYDFEELDLFTTEADLVYVSAGDRRVLLTDRASPQRETQRPAKTAEGSDPEPAQTGQQPHPEAGRFSHLEF